MVTSLDEFENEVSALNETSKTGDPKITPPASSHPDPDDQLIRPIQERLIVKASHYQETLFNHIQSAKEEILLSSYIFENDPFGQQVLEHLLQSAERGVQVKVVLDGLGSMSLIRALPKKPHPRFEMRVYHPLPWPLSKFSLSVIYNPAWWFRFLASANRRNHQKLVIIDNHTVLLGSRNIHDQALHWRETNILVQGYPSEEITILFYNLWNKSYTLDFESIPFFPRRKRKQKEPVTKAVSSQFLWSRIRARKIFREKLLSAKKKILITTPYLNPSKRLFKMLCKTSEQGVRVRILLPRKSDVLVSKWIAQLFYKKLLASGIEIFEYRSSILHSKTFLIDDWALIGSSNFNQRSIWRDLEIDYFSTERKTLEALENQFEEDLKNSIKIDQSPQMGVFSRLIATICVRIFPSWF